MCSPEDCHLIAKQYDTKGQWMAGHRASYNASKRLGVFDSCTAHMRQGNQKWTEEACMKDSLNYKTKRAWKEGNHSAYRSARRNGWFEACTAHMDNPKERFTLDIVLKRASKYRTWTEWKREDRRSYMAAQRKGWLDDVAAVLERPSGNQSRYVKWNEQTVRAEAKKYGNKTAWASSSPSSYQAAKTLGIFSEVTRHMVDPRIKQINGK